MNSVLQNLVHELAKLPGVGEKTALRFALSLLRRPAAESLALARSLEQTVSQVTFCSTCFNLSTATLCDVCNNAQRNRALVCVVEDVGDLIAMERARVFRGTYHVLHGTLSPIDGVGPEDLKITELMQRIGSSSGVSEVILATNPNVNGDATALYLARLLKARPGVRVTRLASGMPQGSHIEYLDHGTLSQALERRIDF